MISEIGPGPWPLLSNEGFHCLSSQARTSTAMTSELARLSVIWLLRPKIAARHSSADCLLPSVCAVPRGFVSFEYCAPSKSAGLSKLEPGFKSCPRTHTGGTVPRAAGSRVW